tara:strand:+ start:89247 stop:89834 length:588 start_codon:yes stop_codon:yes gene_type:complete
MNQPHITALAALTISAGCFSFGCNDKAATSETQAESLTAAAPEAPQATQPARTLDPSYVPNEALEQLEGLTLESTLPCSDTIETLRPALESIASFRLKLVAATTEAEVVQLLTALSTELTQRLPSIATRSETDELRRISAELTASVGDLAESLKLASDAITAQDKQASAAMTRRLQNGVANTRSSIERLIEQCAV